MSKRRSLRWARDEIARLDPTVDFERITHLNAEVRFGWPPIAAAFYTVTFVRQSAVPSIARVLYRGGGGPTITASRKRNDDTLVLFGELFAHGPTSERGQATADRIQEIHGPFAITQDDYRYTLCSIIDESERSAKLIGYHAQTWSEDEARFRFWHAVGERMGITDLPDSYAAALAYAAEYERTHWAVTKDGRAIADAVIDDYVQRYLPRPLWRFGHSGFLALLGPELRRAHGYPEPSRLTKAIVLGGLRTYLRARRVLPDPPVRPVTVSFGQEYGAVAGGCPHLADVGYASPRKSPPAAAKEVPARMRRVDERPARR